MTDQGKLLNGNANHSSQQNHIITDDNINQKDSKTNHGKKKRHKKKIRTNKFDSTPIEDLKVDKKVEPEDEVDIVYVGQEPIIDKDDPNYEAFSKVFGRFVNNEVKEDLDEDATENTEGKDDNDDEENSENSENEEEKPTLSKKKLRKLNRMNIAELKQQAVKPEIVEWVDITAADPTLLVHLKAYRNTVPIPKHWSQKRKYLQGKRGIEKPPFELPDFIKATGIMEMRAFTQNREESSTLKQKQRERMNPKMGKLDIDYQRLHDAFFRFQTKPYLSKFGDLYYEGREFETKFKEKKPGQLSEALKAALNIPPLAPPPWLLNMQRYGPPPSYPNLTIPGLNAPIPEGAMWGYHPGGWGKPPVDEFNRPLYGDVFGTNALEGLNMDIEPIDRTLWGEMEPEEEVIEEEEEEEEEKEIEESEEKEVDANVEDERQEGLETPMTFVSGFETPQEIELRKEIRRPEEESGPKQLYHVLNQKETSVKGFMGSQYTYDGAILGQEDSKKPKNDGIDVALDPSEMANLKDKKYLESKYESAVQAKNAKIAKEDFSDMVAEHVAATGRKRKEKEASSKDKKRDFKF